MMDALCYAVALASVLVALSITPAQLAARSGLRYIASPATSRARAPALVLASGVGAALAIGLAGVTFGPPTALTAAVLVLLILLATVDLAWRWLPVEWCGLLALIGVTQAIITSSYEAALLGAAVGGGTLLALRALYLVSRRVEALGLGDVWLAAALGTLVGPAHIIWILGLAAGLGLLVYFAASGRKRADAGVAFGAHICAVTPIFVGI